MTRWFVAALAGVDLFSIICIYPPTLLQHRGHIFDGDNELSHGCASNLAPAHDLMLNHSVADWAFEFPVWHLSEGDGSESWKGGRVIAQPCRIFNFLHVGGRTGSNNFTRTGTLLARGRGGLGEQQSRCLRQASQCFTDSRMCRGAHRHLWWTTMKESKPGRNRHSVHRDLITGSHCTCPLCQMKAPRRVWNWY